MFDIIVIGGGIAGLTAAMYAARSDKNVAVLEHQAPGGNIVFSPMVDNYPGVPHVNGAELGERLERQALEQGAQVMSARALEAKALPGGGFAVATDTGEALEARALVLATGTRHKRLGLPGEDDLVGAGISYCAVCDGPFFADCEVAITGGGNTALAEALYLASICKKVYLVHHREGFRAEPALVDRVKTTENIELVLGQSIEGFMAPKGELTGLVLCASEHMPDGSYALDKTTEHELAVEGLFVAVGHEPQGTPFAESLGVELDCHGFFAAGEDCATGVPGVFVAGDCRSKRTRQLTTAAADGTVAALAACAFVDSLA